MRALPPLILCLTATLGCGSGDSTSFADRFDQRDEVVLAVEEVAETGTDDQVDTPEQADTIAAAPNGIGLTGGPVSPPRRAFPEDYDAARTLASNFAAGVSTTPDQQALDRASLLDAADGPRAGSAQYQGTYAAEVFKGLQTPAALTREVAGGDFAMSVDLTTGAVAGQSTDGRLLVGRAARGLSSPQFEGQVSFDGVAGLFDGVLGDQAAQAEFVGQSDTTGYVGGFQADRADN